MKRKKIKSKLYYKLKQIELENEIFTKKKEETKTKKKKQEKKERKNYKQIILIENFFK